MNKYSRAYTARGAFNRMRSIALCAFFTIACFIAAPSPSILYAQEGTPVLQQDDAPYPEYLSADDTVAIQEHLENLLGLRNDIEETLGEASSDKPYIAEISTDENGRIVRVGTSDDRFIEITYGVDESGELASVTFALVDFYAVFNSAPEGNEVYCELSGEGRRLHSRESADNSRPHEYRYIKKYRPIKKVIIKTGENTMPLDNESIMRYALNIIDIRESFKKLENKMSRIKDKYGIKNNALIYTKVRMKKSDTSPGPLDVDMTRFRKEVSRAVDNFLKPISRALNKVKLSSWFNNEDTFEIEVLLALPEK